jgi:ABC-2 type transport system permease protein
MKLIDIALKDLLRSTRSIFAIGMMLVAPLLITGLIYAAFSGMSSGSSASTNIDLPTMQFAVVNLDQPPAGSPYLMGKTLAAFLHDNSLPTWLQAVDMTDETAARAAVNRGEYGAAVIIPANFTQAVTSTQGQAAITLVQDPTLSVGPSVLKEILVQYTDNVSGARIAIDVFQARLAAHNIPADPASLSGLVQSYTTWVSNLYSSPDPLLRVQAPESKTSAPAPTGNPVSSIISLIMIGQLIFFNFFTGAYATISILNEDEEGTLARLFTTPVARTTILAGKFLAVVLTVILQAVVLMLISHFALGIDWGSPLNITIITIAQVAAASGLGIFLISLIRNSRQVGPVMSGGLTFLGMLGGLFTVAVPNMPAAFNNITLFTPHGWVLKGWRLVLSGAPTSELLVPALVLLAMGALFFTLGAMIFRKRFA